MAVALRRRHNARNIVLELGTRGESVGVRRRGGGFAYYPFGGFIERRIARVVPGARSARLEVVAIGVGSDWALEWQDVPEGRFVLGCVYDGRAYGVLEDQHPVVI